MMTESPETSRRTAIPAEIKRKVLVEAGHRCAIPTCRYIEVELHHIVPWSQCQEHEYQNLIALCANCHRRADRGEIDRKALRIYKANLRFAHDKFSQLEIDLLFQASHLPPDMGIPWYTIMLPLLNRITEAKLMHIRQTQSVAFAGGAQMSPVYLQISDKGRQFLAELSEHEI